MSIIKILAFCCNSCPRDWVLNKIKTTKFQKKQSTKDKIFEIINKNCNSLKIDSGMIFEAGVFEIFNKYKEGIYTGDNVSKKITSFYTNKTQTINPDGYLKESIGKISKGLIEVRGFQHHMTGSADEKNVSIYERYEEYPYKKDEKLSVIFCGKITKCNEKLLIKTKLYHRYLKSGKIPVEDLDKNIIKRLMLLFEVWKEYHFNGFFKFDDLKKITQQSND